jgi:hypothetical protein
MKIVIAAAILAALSLVPAQAQQAPAGSKPPGKAAPVCLRPFDVSGPGADIHTHVLDPKTILFYMPSGKVWVNNLLSPCRGLMFHGFEYVTHQDELCSNAVAIRVLESGEVCHLGAFTPYTPPPAPQHAER